MSGFDAVADLRRRLQELPHVPVEKAAQALGLSERTMYRRRGQFEHFRKNRHLYFTVRSLVHYAEIEQYNGTKYEYLSPPHDGVKSILE